MTSLSHIRARRPLLIAVTLLAASALVTGCAPTVPDPSSGTDDDAATTIDDAARALLSPDMREAGTVSIGLGAAFPPYSYRSADDSAEYTGYEPELMNAIMARLGLTPEYSDVASVGDAVPAIEAGRIQVAALGITDSEAREESVIFVDNLIGRNGAIFPAAQEGAYSSFADMCGLTVATVSGSVSVLIVDDQNTRCAELGKEPMTQLQLADNASTLLAVKSGQADAAMQTYPGASYQVAQNGDAFWAMPIDEGMNAQFPNGIAVDKNEPELAEAIQAALNGLIEDGTYAEILQANDVDPSLNGVTEARLNWATNGFPD